MKALRNCLPFLVSSLLIMVNPVSAETQVEIEEETPAFSNKELVSGSVRVLVNYSPLNTDQQTVSENKSLQYKIFYNDVEQLHEKNFTRYSAKVTVQDLDNDGTAEVIARTFSSGAHCCTNFAIYSWQNNRFTQLETGMLDGYGGEFRDLDKDGQLEFVTVDNAFLYQFGPYVNSFPPLQIFSFRNGKLQDVTRQHPTELRSQAWQMYKAFLERKDSGYNDVNGLLASYVTQKILLGESQEGWNFMLAHYDRNSDWGLDIHQGDRVIGQYSNFPTALKAFLIKQGYLK